MTRRRRTLLQYGLPCLLVLAVLLVRATEFTAHEGSRLRALMQEQQYRFFDELQRQFPRELHEETNLIIVDIDDASLARFGQWPWPRTRIAQLLNSLSEQGVAAIAMDIVFAEPDRTSPSEILPLWETESGVTLDTRWSAALPDHDRTLAYAIKNSGRVITGFVLKQDEFENRAPLVRYTTPQNLPLNRLPEYTGAVTNLPILEKAAAGNGFFNTNIDRDNVIRRIPLLLRYHDRVYFSLASETLRTLYGNSAYQVKIREPGWLTRGGIDAIRISDDLPWIPTDEAGRLWMHYRKTNWDQIVSAQAVLDHTTKIDLQGKIVFLGTSAPGLKDLRSTPLEAIAPGVDLHLQVLEQIFTRHFLTRPSWATPLELLCIFGFSALLIYGIPRLGPLRCAIASLCFGAFTLGIVIFGFTQEQILLDPIYLAISMLLTYLASSLLHFLATDAERKQIRGAFSRYLSPDLVAQLAANPEKLTLGGERALLTILFCDVRGFTSLAEGLEPEELTSLINQLLTPLTEEILQHRGTIDKYMGDCIMAFWNAPLTDEKHAENACRAALKMLTRLDELNRRLTEQAQAAGKTHRMLQVGIGINTGNCCVGNMGSDQRFDYSVIGDEVNLASRLEGQSKTYGIHIVLGENTAERIPTFATLELDLIRVKGKSKPVRIHTLIGDEDFRRSAAFRALQSQHAAMLVAYRAQNWHEAIRLTQECVRLEGAPQELYKLYTERIREFETNPPPTDWDGVFVATTK